MEEVKEGLITDNALKSKKAETVNDNELKTIQTREKLLEGCKEKVR